MGNSAVVDGKEETAVNNIFNPLNHPISFTYPARIAMSAWIGHVPFAMYLIDTLRPNIVVELGTHYGVSYCSFCQAVKELKLKTRCYAVDTWQGDPQSGLYGPEVLADLKEHHDPLFGSFSRLIQSSFDEAQSQFENETIDLLHIDGYHTYEVVKHDFETWLPKMSKRGVVLLHDTNVREGEFGVWRLWNKLKRQYPHFEFLHSHGLGILAVGQQAPELLRELLSRSKEDQAQIREIFWQLGARLEVSQELQTLKRNAQAQSNESTRLQESLETSRQQLSAYETQLRELTDELARKTEELFKANGQLSGYVAQATQQAEQTKYSQELLEKMIAQFRQDQDHLKREVEQHRQDQSQLEQCVKAQSDASAKLQERVQEYEAQIKRQTDESSQALSVFEARLAEQANELSSIRSARDENENVIHARDEALALLQNELTASGEKNSLLSEQLLAKTREVDQITRSLGWRFLRYYGGLKYRYLLPVYRKVGLPYADTFEGDNQPVELKPAHPSTSKKKPPIRQPSSLELSTSAIEVDQIPQSEEEVAALRKRRLKRRSATITADPNPVYAFGCSGRGVTTLSYTFPEGNPVEIRIGSPDGSPFARPDKSGEQATGKWVTDGMQFFLQDVSNGKPLTKDHTLASVTVRVREKFQPDFEIPREPASDASPVKSDIKAIAFYLPQFHVVPENDEWWGSGFTEWTNVRKGEPQFEHHYQPHVPSLLGHYDLSDPSVLEKQAALAQAYGIYGFCFYYYWFDGKVLLDLPVRRMLELGKPEFPFCICWANENWTRRWDGKDSEVLIGQRHSPEDDLAFLENIQSILLHHNYIRVDGKPLLIVYQPSLLPDPRATAERWRRVFRERGFGELFLAAAQTFAYRTPPQDYGFDAVIQFPPHAGGDPLNHFVKRLNRGFSGNLYNYKQLTHRFLGDFLEQSSSRRIYPTVMPSWDNTARLRSKSSIWINISPESFYDWLCEIVSALRSMRPPEDRIVFINAWNEWAEGCHLEPDQLYGYGWLNATKLALEQKVAQVEPADLNKEAKAVRMPFDLTDSPGSALHSNGSPYESVQSQDATLIPNLESRRRLDVLSVSPDAHPAAAQKRPLTSWPKENAGLFDAEWYLLQNPDAAQSGVDPVEHYVSIGAKEGRAPHPLFDPKFYLKTYPKAAISGLTPLEHYLTKGWQKGYKPNPKFDPSFYLSTYPDIAEAGVEPLTHFISNGLREGRVVCKEDVYLEPFESAFEIPHMPMVWESPLVSAIKAIAFFLPQFHPIPENDSWWGAGFTEWTNVRRGEPQFKEHYQPHVPHSLNYYDLREDQVLERQIELAQNYGLHGFCFYYYWFAGKVLLDMPIRRMLERGKPDFPFCICWANENWTRRWDGQESEILIAQRHSAQDDLAFLKNIESFLLHKNYIRIEGKPLLIVYQPSILPDARETATRWREYFRAQGHGELFLASVQTFAFTKSPAEYGFDAVIQFPPHCNSSAVNSLVEDLDKSFAGHVYDYNQMKWGFMDELRELSLSRTVFPGVMPSWDNTARLRNRSSIFINSSPESYFDWLRQVVSFLHSTKPHEEKFVFINAWNEWAEGCHLEPDELFGYAWLNATRLALEQDRSVS